GRRSTPSFDGILTLREPDAEKARTYRQTLAPRAPALVVGGGNRRTCRYCAPSDSAGAVREVASALLRGCASCRTNGLDSTGVVRRSRDPCRTRAPRRTRRRPRTARTADPDDGALEPSVR